MSCARGCCPDQRSHYKSVALFGPSTRRDADRRESRDMDAYKRLVQSGVQPKSISGAAALERGAESSHEVENRNIITDRGTRKRVDRAFADAASTPSIERLDAS